MKKSNHPTVNQNTPITFGDVLQKGKSGTFAEPAEAFDDINWKAASWEGLKAGGISFFAPPGSQTAVRIAKIGKSKLGKVGATFIKNLIVETAKKIATGDYNDENGNFDANLLQEDFMALSMQVLGETLVELAMGDKADEILEKFNKANKNSINKANKLGNKIANGESTKRISNYTKKVVEADNGLIKSAGQQAGSKTVFETTTKVAGDGAGRTGGEKIEEAIK